MTSRETIAERDALHEWTAATITFLTDDDVGRLAISIVDQLGALGLVRVDAAEAERLTFAAIARLVRMDNAAFALPAFEAVQEWSNLTALSPFDAGLSRTGAEALERYHAARRCDAISDEHAIGETIAASCWFRAANREAFRAVMMDPGILRGEDALAEEMLRISAAEHIARIFRTPDAAATFGLDELGAIFLVQAAVNRASQLAIEQQREANLRRTLRRD